MGGLDVRVAGAVADPGTLAQVADDPLVIVRAGAISTAGLASIAVAHPSTHFALAGASAQGLPLANVAGLVIRDDQVAFLAGAVAGLVAADAGTPQARVAWIGSAATTTAAAFRRGVGETSRTAVVIDEPPGSTPASCKEAALGAVGQGVVAIVAPRGLCAEAAVEGAHEQNVIALRMSDFELVQTAAAQIAHDAVAGIYHGGEDVVFGAKSGAIGIGYLDPRISSTTAVRARAAAQELAAGLPPKG